MAEQGLLDLNFGDRQAEQGFLVSLICSDEYI